jgi:DNA-binding CsgD family transcriptional regulator
MTEKLAVPVRKLELGSAIEHWHTMAHTDPQTATQAHPGSHPFADAQFGPHTVAQYAKLSPRQRHVAELRAEGYSVANIAAILGRSEGTVKTHLNAVRKKLNVVSAVEICIKLRGMESRPFDELNQGGSGPS